MDKEGVPVAVEVKLSRNAQSRREVVAQVFDYVADLSNLTFEELDDIVNGALTDALQELVGEEQIVLLRKQCATNLRAGRIRMIVAVDSACDDLIRIIRYITDHSDIDLRLVCISKFDNGRILVPRILVSRSTDSVSPIGLRWEQCELAPAFSAVINAYDQLPNSELKTSGTAKRFRKVKVPGWPIGIHYEFLCYPGEISVELHLESDDVAGLATHLAALDDQELMPGLLMVWDPSWRDIGRLRVLIPKEKGPEIAVMAMQALIARTRTLVEKHLSIRYGEPSSVIIRLLRLTPHFTIMRALNALDLSYLSNALLIDCNSALV